MIQPRRRALIGIVGLLIAVGLSGCSDQVGAAATVGEVHISESQVLTDSTALTSGAAAPSTDVSATADLRQLDNRLVLTYRIRHQLLAAAAAQLGVSVTESQVTAIVNQAGAGLGQQLGIPQSLVPQAVRDALTVLQLAGKNPAVTDVKVTLTQQQFSTRAEAVKARARALADPSTFSGKGSAVNLISSAGRTLAQYGVFDAPNGTMIIVAQPSDGSYYLVKIDGRTETKVSDLAKALQSLTSNQDQAGALWLSWTSLVPHVKNVAVQVNPRFGSWDPLSLQVVPTLSS